MTDVESFVKMKEKEQYKPVISRNTVANWYNSWGQVFPLTFDQFQDLVGKFEKEIQYSKMRNKIIQQAETISNINWEGVK